MAITETEVMVDATVVQRDNYDSAYSIHCMSVTLLRLCETDSCCFKPMIRLLIKSIKNY